ncbi:MAG TPA: dihydroneopterin aldolase [Acidimicrobiales bacterium]
MTDRIELRGLRVMARCGVLPFEREQDQPIELDIDVVTDLSQAGASDVLTDTIHYGEVCAVAEEVAGRQHVGLLERLATLIAEAVLAHDDRIDEVEVAARKLRPPVAQHLATSGVRITRRRSGS